MTAPNLMQVQSAELAARAVRFGMAAGLLGLDGGRLGGWIQQLTPELMATMSLGIGSGLNRCGLLTDGDPGSERSLAERVWLGATALGLHREIAWLHPQLEHPGRMQLEAWLGPAGVSLAVERQQSTPLPVVLEALATGPRPVLGATALAGLRELGGHLKDSADDLRTEVRNGQVLVRLGFRLPASGARHYAAPVMERLGVLAPQRHYFLNTLEPLTAGESQVTIRLTAAESGLLPEVSVVYRKVPVETLLPIWRLFDPLPNLGHRVGAIVGAVGSEVAEEFELCLRAVEPPTFTLALPVQSAGAASRTSPGT